MKKPTFKYLKEQRMPRIHLPGNKTAHFSYPKNIYYKKKCKYNLQKSSLQVVFKKKISVIIGFNAKLIVFTNPSVPYLQKKKQHHIHTLSN